VLPGAGDFLALVAGVLATLRHADAAGDRAARLTAVVFATLRAIG
jgi:hypothetical protein